MFNHRKKTLFLQKKIVRTVYLVWTFVVLLSAAIQSLIQIQEARTISIRQAEALFLKDKAFRLWVTEHGGVYVPTTESTPPNPFLSHIPERDISTPSGKKLTLMNPAYMVRQMMEHYEKTYGVRGHITSRNYLRPETAPDDWEIRALNRIEKGENAVVEFTTLHGEPHVRLMSPLYAEKGCLKCHAKQGYKEGDLRGGVSLSMPLGGILKERNRTIGVMLLAHGIFWLLGIFFIHSYIRRIQKARDAEQEARVRLQRWGRIFDQASWGVAIVELPSGKILERNESFEKIHGFPPGSSGERISIFDLFSLENRYPFEESLRNLFREGFHAFEGIHRRLDGTHFPVLVSVTLLEGSEEQPSLLALNIQDVTDRKNQEQKLIDQQVYLRTILDAQKSMVMILNEDLLEDANQAFFEFFSEFHSVEEFNEKGKHIDDYFENDDIPGYIHSLDKDRTWISLLDRSSGRMNRVRIRRNETDHHFAVYHKVMRLINGERHVIVFLEITELEMYHRELEKRVTEEIEKRRQQETASLEQFRLARMGELMENIAHHWRQPLNTIGLIAQNLEIDLEQTRNDSDSESRIQTRLQEIIREVRKLSGTLETIQDLETRKNTKDVFQIDTIIRGTLALFGSSMANAGIEIRTNLIEGCEALGDRRLLVQVLLSLFSNVKDVMNARDLPRSQVDIRMRQDTEGTTTEVEDSAGGIAADVLDKIFDPFFTTFHRGNKTGLGLYFARQYVENSLSGKLMVENGSRGARFSIFLPLPGNSLKM